MIEVLLFCLVNLRSTWLKEELQQGRALHIILPGTVRANESTKLFEKLTVECDASEHRVGATLSQNDLPAAFHSRTFTAPEKRYSIIEKEAAATRDAVTANVKRLSALFRLILFIKIVKQNLIHFVLCILSSYIICCVLF